MNFTFLKSFMDSLTKDIVPGNNIIVYKDGKRVFEYSSGFSDLENKIKMKGDEYMYIYSCSKVTTVTAALQLYEQGKFLLTDPLYEYIPEFKDMYINKNGTLEKAKNPITMRDLFTMTAGFSYDLNSPSLQKARKITNGRMDTLTAIKCLAEEPLLFEPGEHWNYSLCHDVLAGVVEVISGKKFSQYVKENIFESLDMTDSYYHLTPEIKEKMAEQYICETGEESDFVELQKNSKKGIIKKFGNRNDYILGDEYDSGGAGIISKIDDYVKVSAALANKGMGLNNNRILSPGTVELMKTNQLGKEQLNDVNWTQLTGYGYGLGVRTMIDRAKGGSNGSLGEFGWDGAAGAFVLCDTDLNLAVFYAHHMLNAQADYYLPRLRNVIYTCINY